MAIAIGNPSAQLEDDYDLLRKRPPIDIGFVPRDTTPDAGFQPHEGTPKPAPITASPAPPVKAPAPIGNPKLDSDKTELARLENTGSGLDQLGKKPGLGHKILSVLGRVGDVAGSAMFPAVTAMIPGTTLHHNLLVNQAQNRVANDLGEMQSEATTEEKNAKAVQEKAKAAALGQPKKTNFEPLYDKSGALIGFRSDDNELLGPNNPNLTQDMKDMLAAAKPKADPRMQPLTKEQADSLNSLWDGISEQYHLPKGQFKEGMAHDDATALQQSLNNVVGRTQGGQKITIQENRPDHTQDNRLDRSYQFNASALTKIADPVEQLSARIGRLQTTVDQATPQADALIAPELLTVMAGGQGSGLRMNEAEISRIVGGRTNFESLKAALNKWQLDPTKGLSVTPAQRQQIKSLIGEVNNKLIQKRQVVESANQALIEANDVKEHRKIVADARKALADIDAGTYKEGGGDNVVEFERGADGKLHPKKGQ